MDLPLTLLMSPEAYRLDPEYPIGRESAGSSWLEAFIRYNSNNNYSLVARSISHGEWFHKQARLYNQKASTEVASINNWGTQASKTGSIYLPGPGLDEWAWKRMPWGDSNFSLLGVVHTMSTRDVQWGLGQFTTAPIRSWDSLVCTSHASKRAVEGFLSRQESWLRIRLGARNFERPEIPIIPIGIHEEKWMPPTSKENELKKSRRLLNIPEDALAILIAGRLDFLTKYNPGIVLETLAKLKKEKFSNLILIIYGEASSPQMEKAWKDTIESIAKDLTIYWIPGRKIEMATHVRWASDLFISLSDNPQETFGITPLEAMASELPCLVSDWDGYKDTVDDNVGVRIPTSFISGLGEEEARGQLNHAMEHEVAVGRIAQGVVINPEILTSTLYDLLGNKERLKEMGRNGRRKACTIYSWKTIMLQWKDLIMELNDRRLAAINLGIGQPPQLPPWMPDLQTGFEDFSTTILPSDQKIQWREGTSKDKAAKLLQIPINSWDVDLAKEISAYLGKNETKLSPRARGWLLKNNLAQLRGVI